MDRKLKTLCVAVAALAALSLTAPTSPAAEFHSEKAHTAYSGSQLTASSDVFAFNAGTVRCATIQYTGTSSATPTAGISLTPFYGFDGCTAFGFVNADMWVPLGCYFAFGASYINSFSIKCPAGQQITIEAFNCWVRFGSQINNGVTYDNAGSGVNRDITLTMNMSGIIYSQENKSFPFCVGGSGTFSNGTYKGSATVKGTDTNGNAVGIWRTS